MKTNLTYWIVGRNMTRTAFLAVTVACAFGLSGGSGAAESRTTGFATNQPKPAPNVPPTVITLPGGARDSTARPAVSLRYGEAELLADRIVLTGSNITAIAIPGATPSYDRETYDRAKAKEVKVAADAPSGSSEQRQLLEEEIKLIQQEIRTMEKNVESGKAPRSD